jgi:soluble lytic murein transglycosylase-like protein
MGTASIFMFAGILAGVEPSLISAVCWVESTHREEAYVAKDGDSPSYGLCQIKLATARDMGFTGKPSELMNGAVNAYYAAKYLRWQYDRYGSWEKAVSAYNCGRACNNTSYQVKVRKRQLVAGGP